MELKKLIAQKIKELQPDMIEASKKFVSINSVNPRTGGPGEKKYQSIFKLFFKAGNLTR